MEDAAPGDADSHIGFVVVLLFQKADTRFGLDGNLGKGVVVDACRNDLLISPGDIGPAVGGNKAVVVVVATEKIEFLVGATGCQKIDACFHRGIPSAFAYRGVGIGVAGHGGLVFVAGGDETGIAEPPIVEVATNEEPAVVVVEVESADSKSAFGIAELGGFGVDVGNDIVVECVAQVAAETEAQAGDAQIVDAESTGQAVGRPELVGGGGAVVNPAGFVVEVAVESRQQLGFVAPVASSAPERDAGFVPGAGQYGVFPLRTVNAEEFVGSVVVVGHADWNNDVSGADIEGIAERLLYPELLEGYFATTLYFLFELAGFLGLLLDGSFNTTMFELYFGTHAPAVTEIVAQHDDGMRYVDTAVALAVGVARSVGVSKDIIAI